MSELKARHIVDVYDSYYAENPFGERSQVYLKAEADKVIAEKDAEIARLKAIRKVHVEAIESMGAGLLQDEKENRHSKYKRCLAMAWWCSERVARVEKDYAFWRHGKDYASNFYKRWHKRWLELAEQFKEAK